MTETTPQESARALAKAAFVARGLPDDATKQLFTVYDLLLDDAGKPLGVTLKEAGPFVFFHLKVGGGNPKAPPGPQAAIAVETGAQRVWDKDPAGFEAWVKAYGYASAPTRIAPELVFQAWYIISFGTLPSIQRTAKPGPTQDVVAPATDVTDGVASTLAWTQSPGRMDLVKHLIRVFPDGRVEASSTPASGAGKVAPH